MGFGYIAYSRVDPPIPKPPFGTRCVVRMRKHGGFYEKCILGFASHGADF